VGSVESIRPGCKNRVVSRWRMRRSDIRFQDQRDWAVETARWVQQWAAERGDLDRQRQAEEVERAYATLARGDASRLRIDYNGDPEDPRISLAA
jgi:hypothetical protein